MSPLTIPHVYALGQNTQVLPSEAGLRLALAADMATNKGPCLSARRFKIRKQAQQECLRALRISFEEGVIEFEELLSLYEVVDEVADEMSWEAIETSIDWEDKAAWTALVGDIDEGGVEVPKREAAQEGWYAYEDHGFTPLVPVGDVLAFGGVA